MFNFSVKKNLVCVVLALVILSGVSMGQSGPMTIQMIVTALNAKLPKGTTREQLIARIIADVKKRKVDKALNSGSEELLRDSGATNELISAIRQNGPRSVPVAPPTTLSATSSGLAAGTQRTTRSGIELIYMPRGEFVMGSTGREIDEAWAACKTYAPDCQRDQFTDEGPAHRVTIRNGFWLGKYEVTQGQWKAVMGGNPSKFSNCGDECPVEQVSWDSIQVFISRLNAKNDGFEYRLPTEAEWEYAARAGTTTLFAFGNTLTSLQANFDGNYPYGVSGKGDYLEKSSPVGMYDPNGAGFYDMHGNVWEWVADYGSTSYSSSPTDGSANLDPSGSGVRVLRGGGWFSTGVFLRSAVRLRNVPSYVKEFVGFRIAARQK